MAQTINTKILSATAQKHLDSLQAKKTNNAERIGSGLRVNSAKDDAAGLAIAERMNSIVRGMNVAMRNAYDGISMSQAAEEGLTQVTDTLQRMRELAVQAANGANSEADRESLNAEFSALNSEISRIASTTRFNGESVLDSNDRAISFQVGSTVDTGKIVVNLVSIEPLNANISSTEASQTAIAQIDAMITEIASSQASFAATQSQLEGTIANLQGEFENQSAAHGRIVDADYAQETAKFVHAQILQQAGTAMSLQANASSQRVINLLG